MAKFYFLNIIALLVAVAAQGQSVELGSVPRSQVPDSIAQAGIVSTYDILRAAPDTTTACTEPCYPAGSPRLSKSADYGDKYLARPMPGAWSYSEHFSQTLPADDQWWKQFDDPVLTELIALAERNNFDLKASYTRIQTAKAQLRQIRSGWYPTFGASAGWTRERDSGNTSFISEPASTDDYIDLGLNLNWEIDVFGRILEKSKGGKAQIAVSEADYIAAQISLSANVAKTYISLRLAQAQLAIAEEHLQTQKKIVDMTRQRMECGLGNKLEVAQSQGVYLSTKASIPSLRANIGIAKNALAVLCGMYPEEIEKYCGEITPLPILLDRPSAGVPADLLRRRPDVIAAENRLAVAAANVGVAKKDFLPTLSLSATGYAQSHQAKKLFEGNSLGYIISPKLSWTIFEGFARNAQVAEARADMEQAIDDYNQTVLSAVQEVNNALENLNGVWESVHVQLELLKVGRESLSLAVDLYKRGLTQFTNVTDAQIDVLNEENTLVTYKAQTLQYAIALYEATGGCY